MFFCSFPAEKFDFWDAQTTETLANQNVISEKIIVLSSLGLAPKTSPVRPDLDESCGFEWETADHVCPPLATALSNPRHDRRSRVDRGYRVAKEAVKNEREEAGFSSSPAVIEFTGEVNIETPQFFSFSLSRVIATTFTNLCRW